MFVVKKLRGLDEITAGDSRPEKHSPRARAKTCKSVNWKIFLARLRIPPPHPSSADYASIIVDSKTSWPSGVEWAVATLARIPTRCSRASSALRFFVSAPAPRCSLSSRDASFNIHSLSSPFFTFIAQRQETGDELIYRFNLAITKSEIMSKLSSPWILLLVAVLVSALISMAAAASSSEIFESRGIKSGNGGEEKPQKGIASRDGVEDGRWRN